MLGLVLMLTGVVIAIPAKEERSDVIAAAHQP